MPKATWALGSNGTYAIGCPSEYRFQIVRPDKSSVVVSRDWEPLAMPEDARQVFQSIVIGAPIPSERPAYARIVVPGDGRIWVFPNPPVREYDVDPELSASSGISRAWIVGWGGSFDVFSEDGIWLATVKLPPGARYSGHPTAAGIVIRGDTIWTVENDDLGAEYVVRYQIEGLPDEALPGS